MSKINWNNKESVQKYMKEWRRKNKEHIRKYENKPKRKRKHKIAFKEWNKRYIKTDKYKIRLKAKYRINKIFKKYDYKCVDCKEQDINKLQIHHIEYSLDKEPEDICILLCSVCHKLRHYNR